MSLTNGVYLGFDKPFLGSADCDPVVENWDTENLSFATYYWEQRPWDPKYTRWAKMARQELAIRKVTKVLLR